MVRAALILGGMLMAGSAQAATVSVIGVGGDSCASWLSTKLSESMGRNWLGGYWTGLNVANGVDVGHATDPEGIFGAVAVVCKAEPDLTLSEAADKVYRRMAAQKR